MASGQPLRVLVVDDDPMIREIACSLLTSSRYVAQAAADGIEALALFGHGLFDLVVTDLSMPGMSGWEVAEAIRATSPATAIVLVTGMVSEEVIHRARVRALPLLPKPFGLAELEAIVTRALRAVGKNLP